VVIRCPAKRPNCPAKAGLLSWRLVALTLPKQLRRPSDVDGDSTRLVLREHLGLQRFGRVLTQVQIGERLAAGVADYVTTGDGVGPPGRREAAG
jgi:hypothetical protein